ncbi:MAG: TonB-dependent receptor [Paludibacter sp.]|nr:TonB-dependent receptor [Paludibacter sp.]
MKKVLSLFLIVFFTLPILASSIINGKIIDADTKSPIEFANVALIKTGTQTPAAGVTTDANGAFSLPDVPTGKYILRLSFIGYNTIDYVLNVNEKALNLGIFKLIEDSKKLTEVEVLGQGSQMRFDIDKKVFSVDQNIAAAGGSASDVLKNIPSVKVDNEGNVSLRKDGNVEVWVNGKPSGLTADNRAQVLQQMPAESIESIEVMTNPSAKFNPEGTAGIINIVMKKNRKAGYYGSVSAGAMYPDGGRVTPTLGANINYSSSKIDAYANVGYRAMSFKGANINDRYNLTGIDTVSVLRQKGEITNAYSGLFMRAGIDFHLDTVNTLSISGFGMAGTGVSNNNISYNLFDIKNNVDLRKYSRMNEGDGTRPSLNVNLDYKHDFNKKGTNLMASLSYSQHTRGMENNIVQKDASNVEELNINQKNEGTSRDVNFKADYTNKITETSRLEAGWQSTFNNRLSIATADSMKIKPIIEYANDFDYNEQIHAAYLTYGNRFDDLSVQGGLRAEYLQKQSTLKTPLTSDQTFSPKPTIQLFPSMYLTYTLPKNNELQLNFTRRVNRPRGRQINPFRNYSDSTNITYGEPTLDPEYASALEFNYMKTWDNHSLSASLYYRYIDNVIEDVRFINNNTMESTYMNIAKVQNSGVELVAKNRLFKVVNLTSSLNLYYSKMDSTKYENRLNTAITTTIPEQSTFSWSANIMANFMLSKTLSGQITAEYSAPTLIAQGIESPEYQVDLGLRKTFFDKKLSVNIMAIDIFNFNKERTTTWGTGFYQINESYFHRRMLGLTVSYNFGNMKPKPADMKKKSASPDLNMDSGME